MGAKCFFLIKKIIFINKSNEILIIIRKNTPYGEWEVLYIYTLHL